MPKGLYGRALIIIIAPMVLLQSVLAFVFMERHWQTVTQRLSQAVTADIAAIIEIIETYPQDSDFEQVADRAKGSLGNDPEGYRAEFIRLVKVAQAMAETEGLAAAN